LNKGEKFYAKKEIESKLKKIWKTAGAWRMMCLGRGFYEFFFASDMDMHRRCLGCKLEARCP